MAKTSPIRPTDDEARDLAQSLMQNARFGALGCLIEGAPMVTRVAVSQIAGKFVSLVSDLSAHTQALREDARFSLLVGEPGAKGDPLTHPRLTLFGDAQITEHATPDFVALRDPFLEINPKAKLYIDFTDFIFLELRARSAHLNGGFGKAFHLTAEDLAR